MNRRSMIKQKNKSRYGWWYKLIKITLWEPKLINIKCIYELYLFLLQNQDENICLTLSH